MRAPDLGILLREPWSIAFHPQLPTASHHLRRAGILKLLASCPERLGHFMPGSSIADAYYQACGSH